jgi:hypothetical protein
MACYKYRATATQQTEGQRENNQKREMEARHLAVLMCEKPACIKADGRAVVEVDGRRQWTVVVVPPWWRWRGVPGPGRRGAWWGSAPATVGFGRFRHLAAIGRDAGLCLCLCPEQHSDGEYNQSNATCHFALLLLCLRGLCAGPRDRYL